MAAHGLPLFLCLCVSFWSYLEILHCSGKLLDPQEGMCTFFMDKSRFYWIYSQFLNYIHESLDVKVWPKLHAWIIRCQSLATNLQEKIKIYFIFLICKEKPHSKFMHYKSLYIYRDSFQSFFCTCFWVIKSQNLTQSLCIIRVNNVHFIGCGLII